MIILPRISANNPPPPRPLLDATTTQNLDNCFIATYLHPHNNIFLCHCPALLWHFISVKIITAVLKNYSFSANPHGSQQIPIGLSKIALKNSKHVYIMKKQNLKHSQKTFVAIRNKGSEQSQHLASMFVAKHVRLCTMCKHPLQQN
jgi:hypothetical protein